MTVLRKQQAVKKVSYHSNLNVSTISASESCQQMR